MWSQGLTHEGPGVGWQVPTDPVFWDRAPWGNQDVSIYT